MEALRAASAPWIAPLDSDDYIEPTYLEQLIADRDREDAQLVYPTMWRNDGRRMVPSADFDYLTRSGRDAMKLTLVDWAIGTNGGLIKRDLYPEFAIIDQFPERHRMNSDEVFDRFVMYRAARVAFSQARYYYRYNPDSVTNATDLRRFDFLLTDRVLVDFVRRNYDDETAKLVEVHRYTHTLEGLMLLAGMQMPSRSDRSQAWQTILDAYSDIRWCALAGRTGWKYRLLTRLGPRITYAVLKARRFLKQHISGS